MSDDVQGLRDKLAKQSEETLGKFAQELLENPLVTGALTKAFAARERAAGAQEAAMGALNIPSAADVERLTRRLRSVAQRLEGIEDSLDKLDRRLESSAKAAQSGDDVSGKLDALTAQVAKLAAAVEAKPAAKPAASSAATATKKKPAAKKASKTRARAMAERDGGGPKNPAKKPE